MLINYFKVTIRNIRRHIFYSTLNIVGLGIGLACCLLIIAYIRFELSYDKFHTNADQIFRIYMDADFGGGNTSKIPVTPNIIGPLLQKELPDVEHSVRFFTPGWYNPRIVAVNGEVFQEKKFAYADSSFFDVFTIEKVSGDLKTALDRPNTIVLSETTSKKYFGDLDPVGKVIKVGNSQDYEITAVVKDLPQNSHFHFDLLGSFSSVYGGKPENRRWDSANYYTYLVLNDPSKKKEVEDKIALIVENQIGEQMRSRGQWVEYLLQPMLDIHLRSDMLGAEVEPVSDIRYIYLFGGIAGLILLIACINYMNLATARASDRAKEVGIRKNLGADRKELFWQFIGESSIVTVISMILAVILAELLMPVLSNLTGKPISADYTGDPMIIPGILGFWILTSLLAGGYPAIVLTTFKPVKVLKGSFKTSTSGSTLRKLLVIFQFTISVILIISTLVVFRQLNFIQDKKLGYDNKQVVVLPVDRSIIENMETIKNELKKSTEVVHVTAASETPTSIRGTYSFSIEGMPSDDRQEVQALSVDKDFIETLGLNIIAGRDYTDADLQSEEYAFIINETTVNARDWTPEEAIGKKINLNGREGRITGVVNDFHFSSLKQKIGPLLFFHYPNQWNYMMVKISTDDIQSTLQYLDNKWSDLAPHRPFEYTFLNEEFAALYDSERQIGRLFGTFSLLAIIIACLGLFGLASFMAVQRAKEISVRKVLGASIIGMVGLLSKDFNKLVLIAFIIAAPLSYYFMNNWLENFAYRISIGADVIMIAGAVSFAIAWFTVAYQAYKAASANPVDKLRYE